MSDESENDSEKVYARPLRRILFVALFGLIALMAMMVMTSEPAEAVVIAGPVTWNTPQVWAEDVTIIAGGDLTIQGTSVTMIPFFDGMWEIRVQSGGTLTVDQSMITSGSPFRYDFWIDQGSRATFIDSRIQFAGYNGPMSSMGIHVSTDAITFSGTTVTNGGMHGIYWDTPTPTAALSLNGCEVAWNGANGIYVVDSAANDYILQLSGFTNIHDNSLSGVFFEWMGSKNVFVDVVDTSIRNNGGSGIFVLGITGGGDVSFNIQGSDISNNAWENVIVIEVNNGIVDFKAFNSNFDFSTVGAGIFIGNVGAGGSGGITVSVDQSFVVGNGAQGILVAGISVGDIFVDIIDTAVERNGLMFGGDGVRMPNPAPGRLVSFSALRSSFSSNLGSGIYIVGASPGDVRVGINTCTIQTNSDMGLYVGPVVSTGSNGLQIDVVNSDLRGNGNTNGVILLGGLTNGNGWINIDNNDFNNSYAALYVASALQTTAGSGDTLTITFTNNWVVSDWSEYGVRFNGIISYFDETVMTFTGNHFLGGELRDNGVYFNQMIRGDPASWNNFTLNVNNNEFGELDFSGFYLNSVYRMRYANINFNNNVLWDTDGDYEYGLYGGTFYSEFDVDSHLNLVADGNQFYGMSDYSMRFNILRIRHVNIDTSNNFFDGMGTMYSGVYFAQLYYGDLWDFSEITFLADNNEFVNMQTGAHGFYVNSAGQMFFRVTDFIFTNNFFNATASGSLYYGVYLTNSYYYTITHDAYFNITLDNNDFLGLQVNGLRLDGSVTEFRHVRLEYTNNLFENLGNIWLDYGVYHLRPINFAGLDVWSSLTVTIADNQCYDLNNDCIRFNNNMFGFRDVTISIERNIFENSISNYIDYAVYFNNGIYYGSNMYDNTYSVTIRENTIRDMSGHGIYFASGSAVYGFRHVDIQIHDNVIENLINPTYIGYGIYWYYEVYFSSRDYDSSINLDFTGNNFTDLDNDGIAFRNWAGWDFGYFRNASVNIQNNNFRNTISNYMDYGIYLRTIYYGRTDADNSIDITITGNTFDSLNNYAIYFYSGSGWDFTGYRNALVVIMNNEMHNTLGNWMDYGVYLQGFAFGDDSYNNYFDMLVTDNNMSDLTTYGIYVQDQIYYYRNVAIDILDNVFSDIYNNFDRGIYFANSIFYTTAYDSDLIINVERNTFSDMNNYGIYFGSIYDYRNATVTIQDNVFVNTIGNWMDYGVYFQNIYYGDDSYDNYFDLTLLNNRFENLTNYGFRISQIYGYRHVTIDILNNYASDVYGSFDYAFYFPSSIYYNTAYDSSFTLTISGNTFMDLITRCIDFNGEIRDFRNVLITVDNNDFINVISNWMDGGVELGGIFYSDFDQDSSIRIDITNNVFENLSYAGFRVTSQIYFRHVTINVLDNIFSSVHSSFDYGVYFSDIFYTTDYDADFTLTCLRNTFYDLSSRAVYFQRNIREFRTTVITIEDNDFVGTISNWMDYGVDFADLYYGVYDVEAYLYLNLTNNNFENISNRGLDVGEVTNFRHTYINIINNYFSDNYGSFDYGVYFNDGFYIDSPSVDSEFILNYLNNEVRNLYYWGYGAYFSDAYNYRIVTILIDNNDFVSTQSSRTGYAIYFDGFYLDDEMYDAYFNFDFTNNRIENLTYEGLYIGYVENYRFTYIDIINNFISDIYNDFYYAIYVDGCYIDSTDYYSEAFLNVLNNEFRDGAYWAYAVYFYEFGNYHLTVIEIDTNDFISTSSNTLGYGVYLEYLYFEEDMYDTHLFFNATNNVMENLNGDGFTLYEIYGFRHVYIDYLDNSFTGQFNNFDNGIYFGEDTIYYSTNFDSDLTINILRNTFMDLEYAGVYFDGDIYDFSTVYITIDDNDFINTIGNWMDYGVYMNYIYFDNSNSDTYLYLDITNNDFHNLSSYGFRMSQIYYYRHVSIDILNNQFSDIYNSFNHGIYFSNDIYHSSSFPGTFDLVVTNNFFNDLTSYAVRFNQVRYFEITDMLIVDNDFSRSNYGFYINGGVDYAGVWDFEFARNNGDDMDSYILYLGGTSYGNYGDMATIWVHDNTMSGSWDGIYVDGLYYYDLTGQILIELNTFTDMKNGYGIELGWFYDVDNAHFVIQDNTITGNMWAAIYFDGAEDMAYVLDIINNDLTGVQNAIHISYPVYGDGMFTVGVINIVDNRITDLTGYGVYIDDVYNGLMDLNIDNNDFKGDPLAYYGVTFFHLDYAEWNSISDIDITNTQFIDGFYGFYFRYQTSGSMITLDVDSTNVTNTFYAFYFDDPISSSSDVFNIKIKKSIFTNSQLSFFYLDDPGYGLFIVDITDCQVLNYGSMGGYGFYMADNDGAYIQIDVYSTKFEGSSSRLGDAFAGDGQILINFWYIDGITSGVANGWNQRMQVLWDVDVQVYVGYGYNVTAGPGIIVYVDDQFWYQSFYTTTNAAGSVLGETVAGTLITNAGGTSFSGQAVHTFWATQGPFSGSAVGAFNANGSIAILLPGDNDGDGLHDGIDIDDDNDGVPDIYDDFPYDSTETRDTDGDGLGNNVDTDDDGDGVPDIVDAFPDNPLEWSDIDGDGVGDNTDIDIDGDGIPNIVDTSPYNNTGFSDSDGDGVADNLDAFPYSPTEWADNDGDGVGDNSDEDDDNDGVPDEIDLYPFDPTRTDTRADEQINIDINEGADLVTAIAILIIGIVMLLLMWLLFGRKKKDEDEGVPPEPEEEAAPEDEEIPEEPEESEEPEETMEEEPEEEEKSSDLDDEDIF